MIVRACLRPDQRIYEPKIATAMPAAVRSRSTIPSRSDIGLSPSERWKWTCLAANQGPSHAAVSAFTYCRDEPDPASCDALAKG